MDKPKSNANPEMVIFTLLLESIMALTPNWLFLNYIRYRIKQTYYKAFKLAVTNVEVTKNVASFLTLEGQNIY